MHKARLQPGLAESGRPVLLCWRFLVGGEEACTMQEEDKCWMVVEDDKDMQNSD